MMVQTFGASTRIQKNDVFDGFIKRNERAQSATNENIVLYATVRSSLSTPLPSVAAVRSRDWIQNGGKCSSWLERPCLSRSPARDVLVTARTYRGRAHSAGVENHSVAWTNDSPDDASDDRAGSSANEMP